MHFANLLKKVAGNEISEFFVKLVHPVRDGGTDELVVLRNLSGHQMLQEFGRRLLLLQQQQHRRQRLAVAVVGKIRKLRKVKERD